MTVFEATEQPDPSRGSQARASHAPQVRAANAEREEIVMRLHRALAEGRLDLGETEERVKAAYAATYRSDLSPLLADLPQSGEEHAGPPEWSQLWSSAVWRGRTVLFGTTDAGTAPPTARQLRTAATLVALAVLWVLVCAVFGALLVAL